MHLCSCVPFLTLHFHRFPRPESPHPSCVITSHAPSLTYLICHTLSTNRDILLYSVLNNDQGDTMRPTTRTPTLNGLRSSWDFFLGRSPNMLAGPAPLIAHYHKFDMEGSSTMCLVQLGMALWDNTTILSLKNNFRKQVLRNPMACCAHLRESMCASCISLTLPKFVYSCLYTESISVTSEWKSILATF